MPYTVLNPATAAAAPATTAGTPLTSVGETLSSIQTEIIAQLQNRVDVSGNLPRLTRWINWGYRSVAQMLDLTELWSSVAFAAVASQPFYLVPASLSWFKRVSISDSVDFPFTFGTELDLIDEPTYRTLPDTGALGPPTTTDPNIPCKYFRFSRMLVVWPTPSSAFTLVADFRVRPLDLANATDSPMLPSEFHEGIVYAGLERAWRALRNPQAANQAMNDKLAVIRPLLDTDAEERSAMHMRLTPVRSEYQLFHRIR